MCALLFAVTTAGTRFACVTNSIHISKFSYALICVMQERFKPCVAHVDIRKMKC